MENFSMGKYNAMASSIYIDEQDSFETVKGYFSGQWNFFRTPNRKLIKLIEKGARNSDETQRNKIAKLLLQRIVAKSGILPLYFSPNLIYLSSDISKKNLEYYGNTVRFHLFGPKEVSDDN